MSARNCSLIGKIRSSFRRTGIDGLIITDMTNVRYLSGFSGTSGFLFITRGKNFFVTDFRYREQAEQEVSGWKVFPEKGTRIHAIKRLVRITDIRTLGFESSAAYSFYRSVSRTGLTLIPVEGLVEKMREQKKLHEISAIREAIRRAETAFLEVKPHIKHGVRELTIAMRIEERLKKNGCKKIPFEVIVASGPNSAMPHARPTGRKLQEGDFVLIDWGGEADGYFSDMTRTLLLKGSDIRKQKKIYTTVLEANKKALSAVAAGIQTKQIDNAARDHIKKNGYGDFFGHGTGHGVGLQVHEAPRITWTTSSTVREKMVFTVEPGIYLPGFGGVRIEDMVEVGDKKAFVLTSLPKTLEII
ncbi:MAG: aminopeptidase P family protein [Thermodesulfovibrionales bacterium]|nr:aminopeptidase P family protein [Thermodesulfovibrionales bacterium]